MKINLYTIDVDDNIKQKDFLLNNWQWVVNNLDVFKKTLIKEKVNCNYNNKLSITFNCKIEDSFYFDTNKKIFIEILNENNFIFGMNKFIAYVLSVVFVSGDNKFLTINAQLDILSSILTFNPQLLNFEVCINRTTSNNFLKDTIHLLKDEEDLKPVILEKKEHLITNSDWSVICNYYINYKNAKVNYSLYHDYMLPSNNIYQTKFLGKSFKNNWLGFGTYYSTFEWNSGKEDWTFVNSDNNNIVGTILKNKTGIWYLPFSHTVINQRFSGSTVNKDFSDKSVYFIETNKYLILPVKKIGDEKVANWKNNLKWNFSLDYINYIGICWIKDNLDYILCMLLDKNTNKYYLLTIDFKLVVVETKYIDIIKKTDNQYLYDLKINDFDLTKYEKINQTGNYSIQTNGQYQNLLDVYQIVDAHALSTQTQNVNTETTKQGALIKDFNNWANDWIFYRFENKVDVIEYDNDIYNNNLDLNYINFVDYKFSLNGKEIDLFGWNIDYSISNNKKIINSSYCQIPSFDNFNDFFKYVVVFKNNNVVYFDKTFDTSIPSTESVYEQYMYSNANSFKIAEQLNNLKMSAASISYSKQKRDYWFSQINNLFTAIGGIENSKNQAGQGFLSLMFGNPSGINDIKSGIGGMFTTALNSIQTGLDNGTNYQLNAINFKSAELEYEQFYANLDDKKYNVLQTSGTINGATANFGVNDIKVVEYKPVKNEFDFLCYLYKKYGKSCFVNQTNLLSFYNNLKNNDGKVNYLQASILNDSNSLLYTIINTYLSIGVWIYV